jgi:NAD(P)-dependent dehydrogenase (short-subunit alcohol dehydrogenase family)
MALAKELGPRNIRVNVVATGLVDTEGKEIAGSSAVKRELLEHRRLRSARDSANRRKSRRSSFFLRRMVRRG